MDQKTLSKAEFMQAVGLWMIARKRYLDGTAFEKELLELLNVDSGGFVSDAMWSDDDDIKTFAEALEKDGISAPTSITVPEIDPRKV